MTTQTAPIWAAIDLPVEYHSIVHMKCAAKYNIADSREKYTIEKWG